MALSYSVNKVDENGKEILSYGTKDFPIAFFDDDLTKVTVPWHWHEELELILILDGTVEVNIAGQKFILNKEDGYFANSSILHSAKLLSKSGHQHAMVFSPDIISPCADLIWHTYLTPVVNNPKIPFIRLCSSTDWHRKILEYAKTAWQSGAYDKKNYPLTVREALSRIFAVIIEHSDFTENEFHISEKEQQDEFRIKKMLTYMEENYSSPLTIHDIAKSADISVSTCLRLFKTIMHTTPVSYLIKYRLQKSAQLLRGSGNIPIYETAYLCGFSDASYYNRCFKKEYGTTPTEYIKQHSA